MTPFEKFQVAAKKYGPKMYGHITRTQINLREHGLLRPLPTDIGAVEAMADALHTFYKEVSDNRGKISGIPTGEADVDVMLLNVLHMCSICEVAPPDKLVGALARRLGLYGRRRPRRGPRRGNQFRVHQGKLNCLASYFFKNPKASQRQAAIVTGLDRKTVRKYMALPEWERLLIPKWSSTRSAPH